jgi:hypothetical protein
MPAPLSRHDASYGAGVIARVACVSERLLVQAMPQLLYQKGDCIQWGAQIVGDEGEMLVLLLFGCSASGVAQTKVPILGRTCENVTGQSFASAAQAARLPNLQQTASNE